MGTRATYQIEDKTFYIHWDGYPEGAATYFYNMIRCENRRGGYAERFLRSNKNAEFTENHAVHGDTEYRYSLNKRGLLCADERLEFDSERWEAIYAGTVEDFINQYTSGDERVVNGRHGLSTIVDLKKELKKELKDALRLKNAGHTGNAASAFKTAWEAYTAIIKGTGERMAGIEKSIKRHSAYFVRAYKWDMPGAVKHWNESFYNLPEGIK